MMQLASRLVGIGAVLALAAQASPAAATSMRYLDLEAHMGLSEWVVRAKVGEAHGFVENALPFTDTTVEVLETIKGEIAPGARIKVRQLRGEVGGIYRAVHGDAELLPGEEVILFLHGVEGDVAYLTALGQSKYMVDRPFGPPSPGGGGEPVVIRDLPMDVFQPAQKGPQGVHVSEPAVDLGIFLETLRSFARSSR